MRRVARLAMASATVLAALGFVGCGADESFEVAEIAEAGPADYQFEIPVGAGKAIDRGEPLEVLPGELEVRVGEVIEIVNLDNRGHLVGPSFVGANETLRQKFSSPGEFIGSCTVHPSGELVLTVLE